MPKPCRNDDKLNVVLTKGRHVLTVRMVNGFFNLDYIDFKLEK
jgi:hypothetical protein